MKPKRIRYQKRNSTKDMSAKELRLQATIALQVRSEQTPRLDVKSCIDSLFKSKKQASVLKLKPRYPNL